VYLKLLGSCGCACSWNINVRSMLHRKNMFTCIHTIAWFYNSRVVSVLDSGAEGPGFKSQSRRCRVTVKQANCSHPSCLCSPNCKIGSSPLKGCGGNCRPGGKYRQPTAGFMTHVTCRLTAKNRDQLRNPTLGNRVRAAFTYLLWFYQPMAVSAPGLVLSAGESFWSHVKIACRIASYRENLICTWRELDCLISRNSDILSQRRLRRTVMMFTCHMTYDTGRRRGAVVSGVRRMNEVNARRARLVPGWVTVFGRVYHLGM